MRTLSRTQPSQRRAPLADRARISRRGRGLSRRATDSPTSGFAGPPAHRMRSVDVTVEDDIPSPARSAPSSTSRPGSRRAELEARDQRGRQARPDRPRVAASGARSIRAGQPGVAGSAHAARPRTPSPSPTPSSSVASCRLPGAAGLPLPAAGRRVNGFKVDFYWPELGLVVETDGLRYHRTPAQQSARPAARPGPSRCRADRASVHRTRRFGTSRTCRRRSPSRSPLGAPPNLCRVSELPQSVRIREVGPRDGFQNEPEVIPTAEKVRLIGMLAATGPAAARGDLVRAAGRDPAARRRRGGARRRSSGVDGRRLLGPDPERARARARARPARSLRRGQPLPLRLGDPQPQERQPLDRRVARRARAGDRARPRRGPALRGRDLDQLRLSLRGRGARRARPRDRRAPRRRRLRGGRLRRHDRDGEPAPGRRVLRRRPRAPARRRADRALPQHPRPGPRQRARRARRRDRLVRVGLRRARRLPGAAGLDRQHLDRGPRLDARGDGRSRPASTCRG